MPSQAAGSKSPPRALVAFRVGIVGHRPNRLPRDQETLGALQRMLRSVLEQVKVAVFNFVTSDSAKDLYSNEPPILCAVSPLAEGSDRMFAEKAIDVGYRLLCPMPFHQEEFEKDFLPPKALEPDSLARFRSLLDRSRVQGEDALAIFELDGDRRAEQAAYGAAGRVVLNQSDLLIAVWDGGKPAGAGGTVQLIREAVNYHVPVLWIHPLMPNTWQLLSGAEGLKCLEANELCRPNGGQTPDLAEAQGSIAEAIKLIVTEELGLPASTVRWDWVSGTRTHAARYFRESKPWLNFAFMWRLFRDVVGEGRFRLPRISVRDFETQISDDWPIRVDPKRSPPPSSDYGNKKKQEYTPTPLEDWVNRQLRTHYAWADKRGDLYADAYRSAYLLIYIFSAVAVFLALLPMAAGLEGPSQVTSVAVELAALLFIVFLLILGSARHWHERWMEYRLLAEKIRQVRILIPLGGGRPFARTPAHLGVYGNLNQTWMHWHARAIARAAGIPSEKVTSRYVLDCVDYIGKIIGVAGGGQLKFHQDTERRSHRMWHQLHVASTALFILTIISIVTHLLLGLSDSAPRWLHSEFLQKHHSTIDRWLVLLAATLPALGAALAGIVNHGEFARLAKRSASMRDVFAQFSMQIKELLSNAAMDEEALKLSQVIPLAEKISEVMVDEVSDWRAIVIEPPVTG